MKRFNTPEIEVIKFNVEDIIRTSGDNVVNDKVVTDPDSFN